MGTGNIEQVSTRTGFTGGIHVLDDVAFDAHTNQDLKIKICSFIVVLFWI